VKIEEVSIRPARPYSLPVEASEALPFRIRLVLSTQDLLRAVEIRSSAYSRHVPVVGEALRVAEADDYRSDVLSIFAERKADGRALGSVRLQSNLSRPLRIEGETLLPPKFQRRRLVEFMRLGVENGLAGRMVSSALVKAGFEICHACGFDFILAAGRRSVASIYRSMAFDDVLEGGTVPLSYANHLPHGIFSIPVDEVDRRLPPRNPGLYRFMARTHHPDITIDYDRVFDAFGHR
jgi:hypothetical protein